MRDILEVSGILSSTHRGHVRPIRRKPQGKEEKPEWYQENPESGPLPLTHCVNSGQSLLVSEFQSCRGQVVRAGLHAAPGCALAWETALFLGNRSPSFSTQDIFYTQIFWVSAQA